MKKLTAWGIGVMTLALFECEGQRVGSFPYEERPISLKDAYGLFGDRIVEEAGSMGESKDNEWWVNSGGYFFAEGGIGRTIQGELSPTNRWFKAYARANPLDTDGGSHPQNIFRLLTKKKMANSVTEACFKINSYYKSKSPNRDSHNGFLFFGRYKDGDTTYYSGLRVDGNAVVKKKLNGVYYTLVEKKIFPGTFNRETSPNLLPTGKWMGLRVIVRNDERGSARIAVFLDRENNGKWSKEIDVFDEGDFGERPIQGKGYGGIRTDFMDVEFQRHLLIGN